MRAKRMGFWRTMDLASVGLAVGIIIGRVGDLVIGDHIGKPTDFPLGWRCLGEVGGPPSTDEQVYRAALEAGNPPALGCFDVVLHQTALYDLVWTALLLGLLWRVGRTARNTGLMILVFTVWYGFMRVVTDFLRVDKTYFGLTGSQITALLAMTAAIYLLARYRGAPPKYASPPPEPPAAPVPEPEATTESEPERREQDVSPTGDDAP
jgi:phosphatidylglycerol---prolipoprotein diacylglyceryl transferase